MNSKRHCVILFCALAILSGAMACAHAQEGSYPDKPINLYVGYAPGGYSAVSAQIVADKLRTLLKQPVVVQFKPGAVQAIAADLVKKSKPDGYTLVWFAQGELVAKLAKDKAEGVASSFQLSDFEPLAGGPTSPNIVAVSNDSPWQSIEEFVDAARKAPGKLSMGSTGVGSTGHLQMEIFAQRAGISLNHVPYQGGAQVVTAVGGRHIDVTTFSSSTLGSQIKAGGKLRPLLVLERQRTDIVPDVPTATEKGYDLVASSWQAISAPKGLPEATKKVLVEALANTMKDPEVVARLRNLDSAVQYMPAAEVESKSKAEYAFYLQGWESLHKK